MDKQSSSINQWTKGSNNDSKSTQKTDYNSKTASNCNSFEFLDMSACDETQKLKLKNTLSSPSSFTTPRERYRSNNFAARNPSIKPTPQQYSTIQYHANNASKSQKPNYQFYQPKHPNAIEHDLMMRHVSISSSSSRSFSSDANNFSSKNNSNFNNNLSALNNNTTNISSKRLNDDNRHSVYPNTQEKLSKWHSKKPPYVGLKEPTQVNQKETSLKRAGGLKESTPHYHPKDLSRDTTTNKNYPSCNRIMSPLPLTNNFQTNTTSSTTTSSSSSSMSNQQQQQQQQSNVSVPHHYTSQQISYGATPLHPQMYPSGTVPLIQHYPIHHPGYMNAPGQPMIPAIYSQHDRNDSRDLQNDHQSNSSHQMNPTRGGRRGRSRGGNNNMVRREYQMRQSNQHPQQQNQSSITSNDYGPPLMDQSQPVMNTSGPFQQIFFSLPPAYYGAPNPGSQLGALPASGNAANAQNLTGQPLFAIQPTVLYQYGSHYPIMYPMMQQPHPMAHQQDMTDNEHNQNQEPGGTTPTTVIQQMPWPHHVAYQEPPQMFQHSPHLNAGEAELEFTHPDEYHQMQMMNHANSYHLIPTDQHGGGGALVNEIVQTDPQQEGFVDGDNEEQQMYQQDVIVESNNETDVLLVEKTRDLMIQTSPQDVMSPHMMQQQQEVFDVKSENKIIVPNPQEPPMLSPIVATAGGGGEVVENVSNTTKFVDNKMIVKNKEKPPAWGPVPVPNVAAQASVKKQTASVSVSAIPNKDVLHLQQQQQQKTSNESINDVNASNEMIVTAAGDKDHFPQSNQTSFSSITASKQASSLSSPTFVDIKKTENKQNEIQPLHQQQQQQKQQQMALSERAKQQIVTTITGVGATSQDPSKKIESKALQVNQSQATAEQEVPVVVEKVMEPAAVKATPVPAAQSAASRSSWAGLFNANEGGAPASRHAPSLPTHIQTSTETQKATTAKNPETLSVQQPSPQVPGVMSYSAVSAQSVPASTTTNYAASVTTIPSQMAVGGVSLSKNLPQSKLNLNNNNNNENHTKSAPVDQHALKLGDFFSKYKIESSSISLLPRGLLNKSNYCYINAILQALVACPPFYHLMKSIPQIPQTYRLQTKTPVTDAMVELVSYYSLLPYRKWAPREKSKKDDMPEISRDSAFEPIVILKMLQALRTDMFPIEGRQEDAEEFLSFILNRMNDEMIELKKLVEKPKPPPKKEENGDDVNGNMDVPLDDEEEWQVISGTRNKSTITRTTDFGRSPISDIFGGKLRLRVHREGDHSSDNIEPFFTLKLVIDKASSVREALEILVGRDQLEGVTCSRTNQEVAAWQQVTLEELPVVLILHLKCFDFKKESCTKILKTVEFPVELKIDPKIMASKNKYQPKQKQYKLFAVVYHDGKEASKGHYITDVFHVGYSSWIRYDDSTVKAVPESNVLHPKSPRVPYLLYYRRYDTIGGNRGGDHNNCNNHQANQKSTK